MIYGNSCSKRKNAKRRSAETIFCTFFPKKSRPLPPHFPRVFQKIPITFLLIPTELRHFFKGKTSKTPERKKFFQAKNKKTPPLLGQSTRES